MNFIDRLARRAALSLGIVVGWLFVHHAVGATIDFEAPTYAVGDLIGQDGWVKNDYYGPDLNGTLQVSSTSPLAGLQSMSYSQTGDGLADVSKPAAILVSPGISGTDVTLSYVIKATQGTLGAPLAGLFLSSNAAGGASPIFARINGGVVEVGAAGAVLPVNSFFFLPGERIKMTYEVDFDTSMMNLILENLDFGNVDSQAFPFFAGYGPPTGPNGEQVVDVGVILRSGDVQIDDITLTAGVGPLVTEYEWAATGSGNWNQATNWNPTGVPGAIAGRQTAVLGASITANQTIYSNATRNLNALEINNANSYVIAGTGSLDFQADSSGPTTILPTIDVAAGAHQLQLRVNLQDDATVTVASGASLDFNNQIDLNGHTLTTSGTVRLNHSTVGGGTVTNLGSLAATGLASIDGNLVSSGALVIGVDASGAGAFQVAGDATLSGILDVQWDAGLAPLSPMTVLSAGGSLDASGLSLAAEDARSFALTANGSSLTLTFLGAAVPEPATAGLLTTALAAMALRRRARARVAAVAAATLWLGAASSAFALEVDFEPPAFTAGQTIVGQNGWETNAYVLADPFFGGAVNGDVTITTVNPLVGAQSVLYNQTSVPAGAGGTGASDVGMLDAITAVKNGTPAIDLRASVLVQADSNQSGNGSVGFFLGEGGRSPIFILLANVNSGSGSGDILVGHDFVVPTVGSYIAGDAFEFTVGVDLDGQQYEAFARNVTAGTPEVKLNGPAAGGWFPFFGGTFPDDGDGQTFTFDASLMLRSGTGRFDDFAATVIPEPSTVGLIALAAIGLAALRRPRAAAGRSLAAALLLASALIAARPAGAIEYTFENPPYTPGTILGQDNWITGTYIFGDPFFGGVVNGNVEISTSSPIAGAQSLLYTQTSVPATAGGTGGSDVSRPFSVFAVKDGMDAVDLTATFQLKANANGVGNGQMGFFLGEAGRSPIFLQVANVNATAGTGDILVGHDFVVPIVGSYVPNSVFEFTLGVDLDSETFEAFSRNVTAGTPAVPLPGPGPNGRFPFFGGAFGNDGDGQTVTFDTSFLLRSGTGLFDNVTIAGDEFVQAEWFGGSGDWTQNASWIPNMIPNAPAGANAQIARFGDRITEPQTVFTNTTQTVNGLRFDSTSAYAVAGAGAVALRANTVGGTVNPTIDVVTGAHELQVAVNVLDNATVTVAAGALLDFNNTLNLGGKTLATSGAVNVNVGVTGGGTLTNTGTLGTAGATSVAASLTSTGTLQFDLGPVNTDFFNVTGDATLSGLVDIVLEADFTPTGSYTLLTATGALNTTGLALDPSDAGQYALSVVGKSLVLSVQSIVGLPGDFNNDNVVDAADLAKWKTDFGPGAGSDADGDGDSDGNDFLIWQQNLGRTAATPASAVVPEPTSAMLAAMLLAVGAGRVRVRRSNETVRRADRAHGG